VIVIVISAYC